MTLQPQTHFRTTIDTPTLDGTRGSTLADSLIQGTDSGAGNWPAPTIDASLFGSAARWLRDLWYRAGASKSWQSEGVSWLRAGGVLSGFVEIDESGFSGIVGRTALQAATEEAYRRVFQVLDDQGSTNLWRAWNYLTDINVETFGLERYRQFNIGRRDAFVASHRSTTDDAPAACAIGLANGPLTVAFVAGETPAISVENPRQTSAYHYPEQYGPQSPTFSRAALAYPPGEEVLFVSGTASIVGHRTVHADDILGQCLESLDNVEAVVEAANCQARTAPFSVTELAYRFYVRNTSDFSIVRQTSRARLRGARVLFLKARICRSDLLLEIEATAAHALGA